MTGSCGCQEEGTEARHITVLGPEEPMYLRIYACVPMYICLLPVDNTNILMWKLSFLLSTSKCRTIGLNRIIIHHRVVINSPNKVRQGLHNTEDKTIF